MDSIAAALDPGWRRWAHPDWIAEWNPRRLELAGGVTEMVEMGSGPPLLLLPPLPGYKEAWVACAPILARRFRVVTYDLRSRLGGGDGWDPLVEDALRVAAATGIERAIVVGHSLGGALAARLAIAAPGRVRAIVLSSAFASVSTPASGLFARWVEQPLVLAALRTLPENTALRMAMGLARRRRWVFDPGCDEHVCGLVLHGLRRIPLGLVRERIRLAFGHDIRRELGSLRIPALIVVGERDTAFARAEAERLARGIPGSTLQVSPGAGHLHPLSSPEWLANAILRWSGTLTGTAAATGSIAP